MRRIPLLLIVLLALAALAERAGAAPRWIRTYGGSAQGEQVFHLAEAPDGTLLVGAVTDSFGSATADGWLLRLGADGTLLSEGVYGDPGLSGAQAAHVSPDGSVVFTGRIVIDLFTIHHAWITRIDTDGTVDWAANLHTPPRGVGWGRHFLLDVIPGQGGGWLAAGSTSQIDQPPLHAWFVAFDATGAPQWQTRYNAGESEEVRSVVATADGGYAGAGYTSSSGNGMQEAWVVKMDGTGTIQWQKSFGGLSQDEATGIVELTGGGYAVSGWTDTWTASGHAGWLIRLDAAGDLLWHRVLGDREWSDMQAVLETSDGHILLTGRIGEPGFPSNDLWLVKVHATTGAILWQRAYEGPLGDWGSVSIELADGDLLVGGIYGYGFSEEDLWVMRLDPDGRISGCNLIRDTNVTTLEPRLQGLDTAATSSVPESVQGAQTIDSAAGGARIGLVCTEVPACTALSCDALGVDPPSPVCEGTQQTFTLTYGGGEPPVTVEWDLDGDTLPETPGNPVATTLPAGATSVTGRATDSCALPVPQTCSLPSVVTVHPDPVPTVTPLGPASFCAARGEDVTLETEAGMSSWQWTLDGADIPGANQRQLVADASGDYAVRVTDTNGCTGVSAPLAIDAAVCLCPPISCDDLQVDADPVCQGTAQAFTALASGGEGALLYEFDFDGDTLPDATGNPAATVLPAGTPDVSVTVTDECADPGPQSCSLNLPVTVLSSVPPPEVSAVRSGSPPLLVGKLPGSIVVESLPGVAAYNVYADTLDSWYFPALGTGTLCSIRSWTDNGDGTLTLEGELPGNSWIVVTASTPCAEGLAGADSVEAERTSMGDWERCGPAP